MEDVKLLLHMWVALFYSKQNKVMGSPRKVVEHRNPAKYVCINRSIESFDQSEIEEFPSVERYSEDPLLENKEACESHTTSTTFPGPNCVLPFINPPTTRDLELCVQNEQKEIFTAECHLDTSGSQNFIHSCNNEVRYYYKCWVVFLFGVFFFCTFSFYLWTYSKEKMNLPAM